MAVTRVRSLGAGALAVLIAAVLGLLPAGTAPWRTALERFVAGIVLLADGDSAVPDGLGWIMGGTGNPLPDDIYLGLIENSYLNSQFPGYSFGGLSTPEQFCPVVCLPPLDGPLHLPPSLTPPPDSLLPFPRDLTFGSSVATGAGILNNAIREPLQAGHDVAVFGYSQSATVATVVMQDLINNPPAGVDPSQLHFVLVGNPNDPLSGILTRFRFPDGIQAFNPFASAPQHLPFLNVPLGIGATPTDVFPTDMYSIAYDGWANFPQDPTNLLADLNAIIGILTVHG
ncbi:MAG TPA: PE-PPE domain-containing protein, partial [Mycobacterium sp.]|nr:PE-PPE domain-containing protein [Mycobacterium sp.]